MARRISWLLWQVAHPQSKRYLLLWRHVATPVPVKSLDDLIQLQPEEMAKLSAMKGDGVMLDASLNTIDRAYLFTNDSGVAAKYDMHDEADFGGEV